MKPAILILLLAASTAAVSAQTSAPSSTFSQPATAKAEVLPGGIPSVPGTPKTLFSLRYQEIKIGTGAVAEPYKLYTVEYTGWLAASGRKFDSSYDHPRSPLLGSDGKPLLGSDGKPVLGPPPPFRFPQGFGRVIPGFDQGFAGMRVGGERRLFVPWQLAYGAMGHPGYDAAHPGIPPKADLIFDVKLVDVTDLQLPPHHPAITNGTRPAPAASSAPKGASPAQPQPK
ncbi:MAG: FKBP-type peptidyl-prolyl cis-trans isomerase [Terracidiphilus sp.]